MITGEEIKKRRKELGLTQKELAKRIGVTQSAITFWEKGKGVPNFNNEVALMRELHGIAETFDGKVFIKDIRKLNLEEAYEKLFSGFDVFVRSMSITVSKDSLNEFTISGVFVQKGGR